jgi:Tfp pilus assembly protein PilF
MRKIHLVAAVLFVAPLLQSCSSLPATIALYSVKAMMSIRHSDESAYGYYRLGRIYQAQNRLDDAESAYKKALSLDERYYEATNALGIIYSMQSKPELAVESFRSALAQAPRLAYLHNNLGHAYYLRQQYQEAIESLESAAALDPYNQRTLHNLGLAYASAGFADKSEQAFSRAQTLRARDAMAVSSVLGRPGATATEQVRAVPPVTNERAATAASAGNVLSRALAASPGAKGSSAAEALGPANSTAELFLRRSDADATLVLINANVYELRAPKSPAQRQPVPLPRPLQQSSALAEKLFRLEVSNGNAVPGMARRVAEHLKRSGVNVVRLTNQLPYRQVFTEIQYREGYTNKADELASSLAPHVVIARAKALRSDIHVRLVLGRDVKDELALFDADRKAMTRMLAAAPASCNDSIFSNHDTCR